MQLHGERLGDGEALPAGGEVGEGERVVAGEPVPTGEGEGLPAEATAGEAGGLCPGVAPVGPELVVPK